MPESFTENTVERAALDWLRESGYDYIHGGVIAELIDLAKDIRDANLRGETLGLSEDKLAFTMP